jgi:hypothetical protein
MTRMVRQATRVVFWLTLCGLVRATTAADGPTSTGAPEQSAAKVMDEIVVTGRRLRELRDALTVAEDRFYALYNALNKVDDFDIVCVKDVPTGTHFSRRLCISKLQRRAQHEYGVEFAQMMQIRALQGNAAPPASHPQLALQERYKEYLQGTLNLLNANPELQQLMQEREAAAQRYEKARSSPSTEIRDPE